MLKYVPWCHITCGVTSRQLKSLFFSPCPSLGPLNPYPVPLYQTMSLLFVVEGRHMTTCWTISHAVTFHMDWPADYWMSTEQMKSSFLSAPVLYWCPETHTHPLCNNICRFCFMRRVTGLHAGLYPLVSHFTWRDKLTIDMLAKNWNLHFFLSLSSNRIPKHLLSPFVSTNVGVAWWRGSQNYCLNYIPWCHIACGVINWPLKY